MANDKNIFLTGGSGFVGRHLIAILRQHGYKVFALVRSRAAANVVRELGAYTIPGNLYNHTALVDVMKLCSVVVHAAAYMRLWGEAKDFYTINVEGTLSVYDAAKAAGIRTFVYISAASVIHGRPVQDADESYVPKKMPTDLYSETKYQAELAILNNRDSAMRTVILRPPLVWGRDDPHMDMLREALDKGLFRWIGDGTHPLSTCHVDNLAAGILAAVQNSDADGIFYITDGEARSIKAFLSAYARSQGYDLGEKSVPRWLALAIATVVESVRKWFRMKQAPPITVALVSLFGTELTVSDAKARRELGYHNAISIEEGLKALHNPRLN